MSDEVHLRIPAATGHIGLARATATSLAARLDFTYDRLMDLHIAIDEASGRVLAASDPSPSHLDVTFRLEGEALAVSVRGDSRLRPGAQFLNPWSKLILESVAGELRTNDHSEPVGLRFLVRRGGQP